MTQQTPSQDALSEQYRTLLRTADSDGNGQLTAEEVGRLPQVMILVDRLLAEQDVAQNRVAYPMRQFSREGSTVSATYVTHDRPFTVPDQPAVNDMTLLNATLRPYGLGWETATRILREELPGGVENLNVSDLLPYSQHYTGQRGEDGQLHVQRRGREI